MSMPKFDNVSVTKKANVFFDGKCVSHTVHFADGKLLRVDGDVVSGGDASGKAAQATPAAPSTAAKPSAPLPVVNQ